MAKNDRYKNEFNFLQAFLQNFASLDKNDEENPEVNYNDGYNAAYNDLYYQHEDEMNRLRLNMVKKVQVADEENQMLVSKVAASKWAQNIKLKKEANKRVKVLEDIKSEKVRLDENRSDRKRSTPPTLITNNFPLVASLIAG